MSGCPCDESIPGPIVQSFCSSHQCFCLQFSFDDNERFASASEIYEQPLLAPEIITEFLKENPLPNETNEKSLQVPPKFLDLSKNPAVVDHTATISLVEENFDSDSDSIQNWI